MTAEEQSAKKTRWHLYLALAVLLVLAAGMGSWWWLGRPKRAAERFIGFLSTGQASEARAMLRDASAMSIDGNGTLTVRSTDGTSAALSGGELPLIASGSRVAAGLEDRNGMGDYLACRYHFQLSTSGPAVMSGQKNPVEVYCLAEGDRIVIQTVKRRSSKP